MEPKIIKAVNLSKYKNGFVFISIQSLFCFLDHCSKFIKSHLKITGPSGLPILGVWCGVNGARTRDLCRDRAAL